MIDSVEDAKKKSESSDRVLEEIKYGAYFNELMRLYSEDSDLLAYPNGYICTKVSQYAAFGEAALSINVGEVFDEIVVAPYGYHIIMRIDPTLDMLLEQLDGIIVESRIDAKKKEIQSNQVIEYCNDYENIDVAIVSSVF
ncbi:MAG: hypothetical protein GX928_06395 [Ruminococcaceae bacterium]|nr:hypothetical protein [Oscillospiraceae bacterium]